MSNLNKLHKLTKTVFNNELKGQKTESGKYVEMLYKRILKISEEAIYLIEKNRCKSVPILIRSIIESIIDISNINDYGEDYIKYLKIMQLVRKYEFYENNYEDYCDITDNLTIINIDKIKKEINDKENELLSTFSDKDINKNLKRYIDECIQNGGIEKVNYRELKKYLTINNKLELLMNKDTRKRNIKYKTWFYVMSQYTHNSLEFIEEYSEENDIEDYKDIIASILKNGLIYVAATSNIKFDNKKFEKIKELKRKIKNQTKRINLWKKFGFC